MQSIVVALDEPYREWIEEAAGEMKAVTGRKDLAAATRPHFTLHVAERYEAGVDPAIAQAIAKTQPLVIETGRVAVVRGAEVVVAIEVERTGPLRAFRTSITEAVGLYALNPKAAYASKSWAPHVSIIAGRMDDEQITAIMAVLARRDFAWKMPLTNVCLIPAPRAKEWTRFEVPRA